MSAARRILRKFVRSRALGSPYFFSMPPCALFIPPSDVCYSLILGRTHVHQCERVKGQLESHKVKFGKRRF